MNNRCQVPADTEFAWASVGWQLDRAAAAATQHFERIVGGNRLPEFPDPFTHACNTRAHAAHA